ncbi:MAG: ABC transporter ATP-binding protein [Candidatus Pacebacteria bacterium]|nr:ABC transporter ATP-binding protein [Candidatus Paceibacterota bacterium]
MSDTPLALDISHVSKSYGTAKALDDISLTVKPGEFFGFLGPNGAGKSTTIHLTTGIARMQTGTIKIFGHDVVDDYREARRHVGLSPQEFNVDIFEKVHNLLDFVAGYYGVPKAVRTERIDALLERFDLVAHADKEFRTLSGGLKRRVLLARAMVHDPELLILDEPTAGVDVELRHELWQYLRELNEAGKTIVLTSHYLEEVELLCNRIAIINGGRIIEVGDKSAFVSNDRTLEQRYLELTKKSV